MHLFRQPKIYPIPSPKIPDTSSQVQESSEEVSAAYPLVNTSGNKDRFPTDQVKRQSEFWELSHQTISKTTKYCNLTVKELKEESISILNSIMPSKKGGRYYAIIDLINGSATKHQVLLILLSLERSNIDKHFDQKNSSYTKYCLFATESRGIYTSILEENYGIDYYNKFKVIGENFSKKFEEENEYYETHNKAHPTKIETEFFLIRHKTAVKIEAPQLQVFPKLSRCLDDDQFNNIISTLTKPLSRERKLEIIGELYHDSYFSMPVGRGAAHNSLMLMYSLYSIAFGESLPPLKEGVMLDLELFNDIDQKKSKEIFLEKFTKMTFFEGPNIPPPPPLIPPPPSQKSKGGL